MSNRLCELLGIRYPVIQAAMGWIAGPRLVAAVSNAGGLGTLSINAGLKKPILDPDAVKQHHRSQIEETRELTANPFALSIGAGPRHYLLFAEKYVELAIEEKVPIAIVAGGAPELFTGRLNKNGIKILHVVSTVEQAQKAEKAGVDAVIAQGFDGGGHLGFDMIPTFVLVPQVVDAVKIPVVACGGVADARQFAAALALGADGVYVGTRFIATHECDAHPAMKKAIIEATDSATTFFGKRAGTAIMRGIKNEFTTGYDKLEYSGASQEELRAYVSGGSTAGGAGRYVRGCVDGDLDQGWVACGTGAGLIRDVCSADEIIQRLVRGWK